MSASDFGAPDAGSASEQPSKTLTKLNPSTGEILQVYPMADAAAVQQAVALSRQAFEQWRMVDLRTRSLLLSDVAMAIRNNADNLASLIALETGKPVKEALEAEIATAVGVLTYYAKHGPRLLKDRYRPLDKGLVMGRIHVERRHPRGVVGVISPWNFPLAIPASGLAVSLMAGNTALLKPSELTPGVGKALVELFQAALQYRGLPRETVQVLLGDGATGDALVHAAIDYAIFTGSHGTGQRIRQVMQARNKPVSLETGGSDPMIALPGADFDAVTTYALWGRYANAGQMCAAVKRLLVPASQYEQVVSLLARKIGQLRVGGPDSTICHMGPVISMQQLAILTEQIQDAVSQGARIVTGGKVRAGVGYFLAPTLLADVPSTARVLREEVFGPVLPVVAYQTLEEAIALANDTPYGLTASVFGPLPQARQVATRLEAGCVMINDVGPTNYALPSVPWGGWKQSGPGVSHGVQGLLDATLVQMVTENWLYQIPWLRKQPWHFSTAERDQEDPGFSRTLLKTFANESVWQKLHPSLMRELYRNRSSKKI